MLETGCASQLLEVAKPQAGRAAGVQAILLRVFPSLTDLVFLIPIFVLFGFSDGARTLLQDGDTGWHIRTGDWILQHRQVPYTDLFSFTKPHQSWFAWEWGWDLLASIVHSGWGLSGVVLMNVAILGTVAVLLYRLVRRQTTNDILAFGITAIALFSSTIHWLARPHLLSWVFILAFLHLIDRAEKGARAVLWWSPVLTLLWVNIHGSFFIGVLFLLTFGIANTARDLVLRGETIYARALFAHRIYFVCALACLAASLINPYGWHLHEHVIRYLSDGKQLRDIPEYASISFDSPLALGFEFFLAFGACAAWRALRQGRWAQVAMILIWAHLGLKSARNIPIFLFIAAPAVAALLNASLEQIRDNAAIKGLCGIAGKILSLGQEFRDFERHERIPLLPFASLALLIASLGIWPGRQRRVVDFDARDFPVAAASVIAKLPHPRVFTFDQWGDYLAYRFFPQRAAFVDGRSDFYGAGFGEKWTSAVRAQYDWNKELSRFSIDTVLLKVSCPLSAVLKESREWQPIFDDGKAILFHRTLMGLASR